MNRKIETSTVVLDQYLLSSRKEASRWFRENVAWSKLDSWRDEIMDSLVCELRAYLTKRADKPLMRTIRWPETWWDHLKEAKAPEWFNKRWPVEYHEEEVIAEPILRVCPHFMNDKTGKHVAYIMDLPGEKDTPLPTNKQEAR